MKEEPFNKILRERGVYCSNTDLLAVIRSVFSETAVCVGNQALRDNNSALQVSFFSFNGSMTILSPGSRKQMVGPREEMLIL